MRRLSVLVLETMSQGVGFIDDEGVIRFTNAALDAMFGYERGELIGQPVSVLYDPQPDENQRRIGEGLEIARCEGRWTGEIPSCRKDGSRFVSGGSIAYLTSAGRSHAVFVLEDVTQQKNSEKALRASEERFRSLFEQSPIGIYRTTPDGRILVANPAIVTMLGYGSAEEVCARDLEGTGFEPDYPRQKFKEILEREGEIKGFESSWTTADGGSVVVHENARAIRDTDGQVLYYEGAVEDVTARKHAEDALRDSEERLRLALDAAGLGTWRYDPVTAAVHFDERGREHFGFAEADAVMTDIFSRVHPDDVGRLQQAVQSAMNAVDGDSRRTIQYRVIHPSGDVRWLSVHVQVFFEGDAARRRAVLIVGTSQDITDRKRTEELHSRTEKLEALGTLAGGIAHDFNNILAAIAGHTQLVMQGLPPGDPARESLEEIAKASARATELVRRILTFSRPQEQKREVLHLGPVVDEARKLLRATLPAMIDLRTEFARDLRGVMADASQVHQVIVNLATNAAHAIEPCSGWIEFRLDAERIGETHTRKPIGLVAGNYVRLSVNDNGRGMDRVTLDRIFDPFFTTKPSGKGTGLGLSVVHGIMRSHGGTVTVESEPGKGSSFHLYFPEAEEAACATAAEEREVGPGRGERILYVDDEEALVFLVRRLLEGLGYRFTGFTDATLALEEFRSRPEDFDLVVTDLSMPGMSGFDLAREMLGTRIDVPIVMTSGYVRPEDQEAAQRLGIRHMILKPNTVDELGHVLHELLRGHTS